MPDQQIRYIENHDYYIVDDINRTIDAKVATSDTIIHYFKGNHSEIFSEFDPDEHSIRLKDLNGDNSYFILQENIDLDEDTQLMPSGTYRFDYNDQFQTVAKPIRKSWSDQYIELNDDASKLYDDITTFFEQKDEVFSDQDQAKRGTLLYGPPGNGKSMTIRKSVNDLIDNENALCFVMEPDKLSDFSDIDPFRQVLSNQNVIFLIEEITEFGEGDSLLEFLDGGLSWNNSYIVATTNYPEQLDANIMDRPGRFDQTVHVDHPNYENRKKFLNELYDEPVTKEAINKSDGLSLAYLKEATVRAKLYDIELTTAIHEIKNQHQEFVNSN